MELKTPPQGHSDEPATRSWSESIESHGFSLCATKDHNTSEFPDIVYQTEAKIDRRDKDANKPSLKKL